VRKKPAKRPPEAELQLARTALENGDLGTAEKHYRRLVKHAELLNDVSGDLAASQREGKTDRALQRVLGDAYMRLGDTERALAAYASILEKPAQHFKYKPMGAGRARKPRA
jgi:predicted negative regulator of RcsB-dependent stress response